MELEKEDFATDGKGSAAANGSLCSICFEIVMDQEGRSTAKLHCGHEFHLDCIGSAFNAKGAMQCPNCRKIEKGRWLYAHGHRSPSDFDFDGWVTEDIYDLGYPELPIGIQWCPVRGFTQFTSLLEEAESQPSYHELLGNSTFGDHPNASNSSHVCPYLALHGFPHPMHTAPSSSADSVSENSGFHRHPTNLGGQSSAEILNSHSYPANESQNHNWRQQHSLPFSLSTNIDQTSTQFGARLSRNDTNSQQRLGSFVHPHPLLHGSMARSGTNLIGSLGPPVVGEVRGHTRGVGNHIYQQSLSLPSLRGSHYPPVRRIRPRGVTVVSSVATSSSAEHGSFYGFSLSGTVNRNHEGDSIGRHMDRYYGWGREVTPLPWIPVEGESQWWGPFNPNQNPQPASFTQRTTLERVSQTRPENGYQRMPSRMPPPYM